MRGKIRKRNFHAHGSDFTAHRGRSVGAFCIFREGESGQDENKRQILWRRPNFFVTICQNR